MSKTRALFESFQENLKMTRETISDVDFSVNSGVVDGDIPEFEAKYNIKITNITEPGAHHNAVYSIEGNAEDVQRFKDEVLVEAEEPKQVLGEDSYETAEEVKAGVEKSGGLYQFIYDEWHNLPEEMKKEIALNAIYELNDDTKVLEDLAERLTESEETKSIELYMNTWANYNENGANIKDGGWMNIEQAKEFLERHKEEEPFINDTNNCPIEVDEYDNPWEVIEQLEYIENCDNPEALIAIIESTSNNFEENKRIYESGDYTFFAGVDNDYDLGKAYYDMVGGVSGISEPENYVNREYVKQNLIDNMNSDEDYSDKELDAMVDEDIEVAKIDNDESFFENYFDFETLGRELNYSGFYYADTGAIQTS